MSMSTLKWYLLFGVLHELSHMAAAAWLGLFHFQVGDMLGFCKWLFKIMLERRWQIPITITSATTSYSCSANTMIEGEIALVRHFGWMFSLILAVGAYTYTSKTIKTNKLSAVASSSPIDNPMVWAAVITALEAMSTDLFGLERYILPFFPMLNPTNDSLVYAHDGGCIKMVTFFCGNFGLILLNPAYTATDNGRKTALNILEKMISVTMVRGAQSGEHTLREFISYTCDMFVVTAVFAILQNHSLVEYIH